MPYDKKLHLAAGFAIAFLVSQYSTPWGLYAALAAGVGKELVDEIRYEGSDVFDMLATWAGGIVGCIIAEVIK